MDKELFKQIPKVDILLDNFDESYSKKLLKIVIDKLLNQIRKDISNGSIKSISKDEIIKEIKKEYFLEIEGSLKQVVNATGIVIHTNLGRAPISEEAFENIKNIICGYSNLEYNLNQGERGDRYHHLKNFLQILTDCEDALIVNNNAAAVFLILNTFSKDKETIVSRGELIEIGGSFRIPDVMQGSGAILKEIGTTNKTKISDYESAISEQSSMIMKVHTSNYKIIGFTEEVSVEKIPQISKKHNIISYYDAGSGSIVDMLNNCEELNLKKLIKADFDIISASGDKMLGGPQAGIIIGKEKYINQIKKNPLLRMLRVDKLTLSLLQETLKSYILEKLNEIPTYSLLNEDIKILKKKANKLKRLILQNTKNIQVNILSDMTFVGGGSCPMSEMETIVLEISSENLSVSDIEKKLRENKTPIIGRIKNNMFLMDLRTIFENQFKIIVQAFRDIDE